MENSRYQPPSKNTHFLVSGGGKGITALNVIAIAEAYQSHFTLIGRSELLESEPDWASGIEDENQLKKAFIEEAQTKQEKINPRTVAQEINRVLSSREIKNTLKKIHEVGGSGVYLQADISDPIQLEEKLQKSSPEINAILHGAGVLADKLIEDKTEEDFRWVYGVKVGGLKSLLDLVPPEQLEYLILFSSVAGFYGNAGQTDYSLSNEILNKYAHHLKRAYPKCQVLSLGWGPWDGGMVTPQLKRIFNRRKIPLISPEEGTKSLVQLLAMPQSTPQFVIGGPLPTPPPQLKPDLRSFQITRTMDLNRNPFLADHVIDGSAVLPTVCAISWMIQACESLYPLFQFFKVSDYKVYKGIVFDDHQTPEYRLEIKEIEKNNQKIVFDAKIHSETPENGLRYHYQSQIELRVEMPQPPGFDDYSLANKHTVSGNDLYQQKILFHGPRFQGIQTVYDLTDQGLTTLCHLPEMPEREMGQFPIRTFNPYLADVHLQSMLVWAHHMLGAPGLPLKIAGGIQYQPVPADARSYATLRVRESGPKKMVADVISHDENGVIFTEVSGAELTITPTLSELFKKNQLENSPIWI